MARRSLIVSLRMRDGREGKRMRCIRGARAAHRSMRAQGRDLMTEANRAQYLRRLSSMQRNEQGNTLDSD